MGDGIVWSGLSQEKYQWPGIAERMLESYDWILNGGKQRDFVVLPTASGTADLR